MGYDISAMIPPMIKVLLMTVPLWLVGVLVYAVGCLVSG